MGLIPLKSQKRPLTRIIKNEFQKTLRPPFCFLNHPSKGGRVSIKNLQLAVNLYPENSWVAKMIKEAFKKAHSYRTTPQPFSFLNILVF